jgi:hypothetical protein
MALSAFSGDIFRFVDFKFFDIIKEEYPDLIYTNQELLYERSFELYGTQMPVVALWRISDNDFKAPRKGFNQLVQDLEFNGTMYRGRVMAFENRYALMAASYNLDFINNVNAFVNSLQLEEVYAIDCSELFDGLDARIRLKRLNVEYNPQPREVEDTRRFYINNHLQFVVEH